MFNEEPNERDVVVEIIREAPRLADDVASEASLAAKLRLGLQVDMAELDLSEAQLRLATNPGDVDLRHDVAVAAFQLDLLVEQLASMGLAEYSAEY